MLPDLHSRPPIRAILESLLWVIYPAYCRCCSDPLGLSRVAYLCDSCWENVPWIAPPYCELCGGPLPPHASPFEPCQECYQRPEQFRLRSVAIYMGALREAIHLLKYEGKRGFGKYFAALILEAAPMIDEIGPHDIILPIPLHIRRYRQRGFNQAEVIGQGVATALRIPVLTGVLKRTRYTPPQSAIATPSERLRNIRGAFEVSIPERVTGKRILVVDDIYTTGATIREARRTLLNAGARDVAAFTLARA